MFSDHCTLNVNVCKNHGYIGEFSFGFTRSEEGPEILHFSTSSQIFHVHIINHLSNQMISVSNQMFNQMSNPAWSEDTILYVTVNTRVKGGENIFCSSSSFILRGLNVFLFLILTRFCVFRLFTSFDHFASWHWHASVWCSPVYFQETRECFPQNTLGFAYFRSLLQSTTTISGGPHRHAYPNTHTVLRCFSVLSSIGIMVLGQRPAYVQGHCALLPFGPPLLLASSISKQAAHYSENGVLYPGSSHSHCLEETLSHPARVPVLTLKGVWTISFLHKIHSNIYIKSSWSPQVFTFQAKYP